MSLSVYVRFVGNDMNKKQYPIPFKKLKTKEDVKTYIEDLVWNAMTWLKIDGYVFSVLFEGDELFHEDIGYGVSISVQYPYKKFYVSVQKDSLDKCLTQPLSNDGYWNNVEQSIFHECIHILLWRLGEVARRRFTTPEDLTDADEEAVDHLTHIIVDLIRDKRKHD